MNVKLNDIIKHFAEAKWIGNGEAHFEKVTAFQDLQGKPYPQSISWVNDKNAQLAHAQEINVGLLILSEESYAHLKNANCNFLIVENPRQTFAQILALYFKNKREPKIENTAVIHPSASIGSDCYIGHHVVIEANCKIGNECSILHNTVILENTLIGNHVTIGANNTIGNYGFGYEKDDVGNFQVIEHQGGVVIHDHVEIHNNTCIDRGVLGNTELHENVKVDNHVHIAHGVTIGKNSLIIANVMIGGSAKIGEDVWVAPSTSIKNQIKIADKTFTGIGAVVLKETAEKEVVIGNPAISMEEHKKWSEKRKKLMKE